MNRSVTVVLGVAAGAAVALAAYSKAGQKVRSDVLRKISKMRESMNATFEEKARAKNEAEFMYI